MPLHYPRQLEIQPLEKAPNARICVPGSKSITNRALVLASLATGHELILDGALQSEDTEVMVESLTRLGFRVTPNWEASQIAITKGATSKIIPVDSADLFVANSGTSMRFLTAMLALGDGSYRVDGVARMRERPVADLLDALTQLGVRATSEGGTGCPPVRIESRGLRGGHVHIKGNTSSQFLSGLLMAAPFADSDLTIDVEGELVSQPYVAMTVAMMQQFDMKIAQGEANRFIVPGRQHPQPPARYSIEPDASAASYFFGAAAITGGSVRVMGLGEESLQGDVRFIDALEQMGCRLERGSDGITVHGGKLRAIDIDMNDISDTVMTLGAVACFADGLTRIRNVAHIRHKETDRLAALATELRRVGAGVTEYEDGLQITPAPMHGAVVETYNDHRMAMSLALVGLKIPGVVIDQPACVSKTYPHFFEDLAKLH